MHNKVRLSFSNFTWFSIPNIRKIEFLLFHVSFVWSFSNFLYFWGHTFPMNICSILDWDLLLNVGFHFMFLASVPSFISNIFYVGLHTTTHTYFSVFLNAHKLLWLYRSHLTKCLDIWHILSTDGIFTQVALMTIGLPEHVLKCWCTCITVDGLMNTSIYSWCDTTSVQA